MKVTAIKQGYFGKLRAVGDEFEVPEGTKGSWFQPVKQKPAESDKAKAKAADKPADDLV